MEAWRVIGHHWGAAPLYSSLILFFTTNRSETDKQKDMYKLIDNKRQRSIA
jgi:hypothetical protein